MAKILIVEDDVGILNPLSLYLKQTDFEVIHCEDWTLAMDLFRVHAPDLVILDINLPGRNGMEICQEIREKSNTPIIMLSARSGESDKVSALDLGADDYVGKPFSPRELLARIQSVLKRFRIGNPVPQTTAPENEQLSLNDLTLDIKNYLLCRKGEEIKITKTEFLILTYLVRNVWDVVLREVLMKEIIGYDHYLYDRTIDTHIKNIRKKLGESATIETVRGLGYKIH